MFISSYNTYVSTNTSEKTNRRDVSGSKDESKSFSSKLFENPTIKPNTVKNLPIDYVSNYKSFNNQQKLQDQTLNQNELKFKKIKDLSSAKTAYAENAKMFSLVKKPAPSLGQVDKIDRKLPSDIQELKESKLRHTMINTYLANENYYRVTA